MWFRNLSTSEITAKHRSSRPEVFCEKGVLRNFAKFTGKHLCQGLFLNKVAGFIEKEILAQVFSCEFCEISKNTFNYRTHLVAASENMGSEENIPHIIRGLGSRNSF